MTFEAGKQYTHNNETRDQKIIYNCTHITPAGRAVISWTNPEGLVADHLINQGASIYYTEYKEPVVRYLYSRCAINASWSSVQYPGHTVKATFIDGVLTNVELIK